MSSAQFGNLFFPFLIVKSHSKLSTVIICQIKPIRFYYYSIKVPYILQLEVIHSIQPNRSLTLNIFIRKMVFASSELLAKVVDPIGEYELRYLCKRILTGGKVLVVKIGVVKLFLKNVKNRSIFVLLSTLFLVCCLSDQTGIHVTGRILGKAAQGNLLFLVLIYIFLLHPFIWQSAIKTKR